MGSDLSRQSLREGWGARPSGPVVRGRPIGLPSKDTLDYAHKLTSTTLLVAAAIVFLVVARHSPARALRGLIDRQVAAVK